MAVPRDSVTVLYIVWDGYGNESVNFFIEQTKTDPSVPKYAILGLEQSYTEGL